MPLVEWNATMMLGIKDIDAQHKQLVDLINDIHNAMKQGKAKEAVVPVLQQLGDYTVKHFRFEESLLESKGYKDLPGHKSMHAWFVGQVRKFEAELAGGQVVHWDVMTFLRDWLIKHIQMEDRNYLPTVMATA